MRHHLSCAVAALVASGCARQDAAGPLVSSADFVDVHGEHIVLPVYESVDDIVADDIPEVPTRGFGRLIFDELLDGNSVQTPLRAPGSDDVVGFSSKDVVLVTNEHSLPLGSDIAYDPTYRAIHVRVLRPRQSGPNPEPPMALMPADTVIGLGINAGDVRDKSGNGLEANALAVMRTAPVDVAEAAIPEYGLLDEQTSEELVSYDAPILLVFTTQVRLATAAGRITLTDTAGTPVAITLSAFEPDDHDNIPESVVSRGDVIVVTPDAPLDAETQYDLRVDPGIEDLFAIESNGSPRLFRFETL